MIELAEARARMAEIEAELRTMHTTAGERAFTADENTAFEALEAQRAEAAEGVKVWEERAAQAERVAARRAKWGSVQVAPVARDLFDGLDRASDGEIKVRAREVVAETRFDVFDVSDAARTSALRFVERVPGAARLAMATSSPDYLRAFRAWLQSGGSPVYTSAEADAVRASMSLTSANGGYVLPFLLDPTLIHTGTATKNPIRRIARVETGTSDKWNGVTASNVTTAWKAEGSAFTDGSPTTGGISVDAAALTAYVTGSYEIFQDSNLLSQLPGLIAESIDYAESTAFISGSGSSAPKGVVTAISATVACTVTATTRGSYTSASAVDTFALLNSVAVRYEDSASWVGNKATFNTIRQQVVGTSGVPVVDMLEKGALLGSPWLSCSDMVSATTSGNVLIVLGDFSQYIVYDRLGTTLEMIPNVVDGSGIPTGQRGLVAFKRVGADVADLGAFRFLKC